MKLSGSGRLVLACAVSIALMLGMSACGGGTIGYLWVLAGAASSNTVGNVISAYKIDDFTGNLTEVVNSPFPTGTKGGAPVFGVVSVGGRYLYVLNQGDPTNSVVTYSVGGDGVLTFQPQQSYGSSGGTPVWMDTGNGYVYVLDAVSPARNAAGVAPACASPTRPNNTAPCGSVEVFQISSDGTGLLTPVLNTSIRVNNQGIAYFPTGPAPKRLIVTASGLIVLNGDGTITSFGNGAGGQLTSSANSTQVIDASATVNFTSITSGAAYLYLTDATNNQIFQYTTTGGVLQPVQGSPYANLAPNTSPVWTLSTQSGGNNFLFVVNSGNTTTLGPVGSISAYQVASNGRLTAVPGNINPFATGGAPICMVQDSSHKYVYTSNGDGTVTGFELQQSTGILNQLRRGSQFTAAGKPTCLVTSGILS